jgi:hypothetical protein
MQSSFAADIEAHPVPPGASVPMLVQTVVSDDYFRTMGIPLLRGRGFTPADRDSTPAVAVVDELTAKQLWPNADPLGQRFRPVWVKPWVTVVGVVGTVKRDSLSSAGEVSIYLSTRNTAGFWFPRQMTLALRTDANVAALSSRRARRWPRWIPPFPRPFALVDLVSDRGARDSPCCCSRPWGRGAVLGAVGAYGWWPTPSRGAHGRSVCGWRLGARASDVLAMVLQKEAR